MSVLTDFRNWWVVAVVQVIVRFFVAVLTITFLGGCGSNRTPLSAQTGRVSGHVLAGPTCPVERPGDTACTPRAVTGVVQLGQGAAVVAHVPIDVSGAFTVVVPVGRYRLTIDTGASAFPVCTPVDVDITADTNAVVDIECDTGIR